MTITGKIALRHFALGLLLSAAFWGVLIGVGILAGAALGSR